MLRPCVLRPCVRVRQEGDKEEQERKQGKDKGYAKTVVAKGFG